MAQDLLELIENAQYQIKKYKSPDVSEVQDRLDEILKAGSLGGISWDKLESLDIYNDNLHINTSYEVRCCAQTGHFEIPMFVIKADNPIAEIKAWARKQKVDTAKLEVERAEVKLKKVKEILEKILNEN